MNKKELIIVRHQFPCHNNFCLSLTISHRDCHDHYHHHYYYYHSVMTTGDYYCRFSVHQGVNGGETSYQPVMPFVFDFRLGHVLFSSFSLCTWLLLTFFFLLWGDWCLFSFICMCVY